MSGYRGNNFPINNQSYLCLARESLQKYGNAMNLIFFPATIRFFVDAGSSLHLVILQFFWLGLNGVWVHDYYVAVASLGNPHKKHVNWCFWFSIFALNTFYFFRSFWVNERPRKISFCTRLFCCFHFAYRMFRSCIN